MFHRLFSANVEGVLDFKNGFEIKDVIEIIDGIGLLAGHPVVLDHEVNDFAEVFPKLAERFNRMRCFTGLSWIEWILLSPSRVALSSLNQTSPFIPDMCLNPANT